MFRQLSKEEQDRIDSLTEEVRRGVDLSRAGYETMIAPLRIIYDEKLFEGHGSFDDWAEDEFGWTGRHARNFLLAAKPLTVLRGGPLKQDDDLPITHALRLAKYDDDAIVEAYTTAQDISEKGGHSKVRLKDIEDAIEKLQLDPAKEVDVRQEKLLERMMALWEKLTPASRAEFLKFVANNTDLDVSENDE